ncbi:sigma-54-dependent Fis family transcriptional regulator [Dissulfurispira thermophila]|uniref:Sigma-54-dependent Fis family transcriptional regulator n=2 Tax=root TaxID=1 RepID=A0A7G1H5S9_9BACT|nr:sigma-54 dependent transcriptional regulator [Dissulfurispira thermophila]BCB97097.1 sigma-54-dependent Fis family transcriptional regulator [Dissulfurispira thermophila]
MSKKLALVVDDEEGIRESLSGILQDEGYDVVTASSGEDALSIAQEHMPDIILLDVWLPEIDGLETLSRLKGIDANIPVIMISGHGNIEIAVKATRLGAYDFLEKPLSLEKIIITVKRALEHRTLEEENRTLKENIIKKCRLIGNSEKMQVLRQQIEMASQSNSRVLIMGQSGTGKELVARLLHEKSHRSTGPFVEVNCAAIPQELIESELFGHEKGAFTGATERKSGKFELADNGTLFLDEIGDMTLQTQAKVLRVIETQTFQRVGGSKNIKVDVRIIAATNKNLIEEVKNGNFREDLYYRLNVIPIIVPPLKDRLEDIPALIEYFMEVFASENGMKQKKITADVIKAFQDYDWPGNIRELKNAVERLMIMVSSDTITEKDIDTLGILGGQALKKYDYFSYKTLKDARDAFEKDFITRKLRENNWNVSKTAEVIDVERSNLHKKIKAYEITEPKN